jgi:GTP-binding nuclear protein Ran
MEYIFNIALIGDHETGKTSFMRRLVTGEFIQSYHYVQTKNHNYKITTNYGTITYKIHDFYGCDVHEMLSTDINFDACITFYTSESNHDLTDEILHKFMEKYKEAKIIICWSKVDLIEEQTKIDTLLQTHGITYLKRNMNNINIYQISCRSNYNLYEPLKMISKKLLSHDDLDYISIDDLDYISVIFY